MSPLLRLRTRQRSGVIPAHAAFIHDRSGKNCLYTQLNCYMFGRSQIWTISCVLLGAFRKIAKCDNQFRNVCLSVRMQQLDSHWNDFQEI